jgi:nucleotide-binding universal stress UspA family protein
MYRRILLAYDGSREGGRALREGALLAKSCGARIYLLSVIPLAGGVLMAESIQAGPVGRQAELSQQILDDAVARLTAAGMRPIARLVQDDPSRAISGFARDVEADLVVVGHKRQSLAERWWSGATGSSLVDQLGCSLLIARSEIDDLAFARALARR